MKLWLLVFEALCNWAGAHCFHMEVKVAVLIVISQISTGLLLTENAYSCVFSK